jgi:hypothetical protein
MDILTFWRDAVLARKWDEKRREEREERRRERCRVGQRIPLALHDSPPSPLSSVLNNIANGRVVAR